ncbi:hypothetical protein KAH37_00770, partial [bacterium]|nr:hypothetical protein [bacterium]
MNARTTALFLILLSFFSLFGLWEWHSLVGPSNTKALAISYDTGSKSTAMFAGMDKEMSGNTVGKCAFMMDGDWYNCPVDLAPQNTALTAVHFRDSDNVFIIRYKMMGLPSLLTFNIHNTLSFIIHDFTMDDNLSMYNLEIVGDTFWAGTRDGAVLISNDEGQSWEKFTITSDSDVEISVVHFDDEMHGYAAGGYIEDDPIDGKILHEKGGIWETEDGGKTWDSVVTKLELMPWKVVKGEADGKWWMVADNDQTYAMAGDPIRVHLFSNDDFENYDYHIPTANTGKKFGGSPYAGGEFTRIGNQLWLGGSAMDNSNVTFMSEDEGETWTELFFPQDHGVPIAIFG